MPEVAIIGAGPAGCAAAMRAARAGLRCTVFEHGQAGRDKACGDAFLPAATRVLEKLGVGEADLLSLQGHSFHSMALHGSKAQPWTLALGRGWIVRRALIDQYLRDLVARECVILYRSPVTVLVPEPWGIKLVTSSSTRRFAAVVIATGSGDLLARRSGIGGVPNLGIAFSAYGKAEPSNAIDFFFGSSLRPGYGWRFPLMDGCTNVGMCSLGSRRGAELRKTAIDFAAALGKSRVERWRAAGEALWSGRGRRWHHRAGMLSCGDAAGLVDPLTGEGLTAALKSGWRAGEAAANFVHSDRNPAVLEEYSKWILEYFSRFYGTTALRTLWRGFSGVAHHEMRLLNRRPSPEIPTSG